MFTGLVEKVGTVVEVNDSPGVGHLVLRVEPWSKTPALGDSIAVQGVCLTLTALQEGLLSFDVLQETFACTTLGKKTPGQPLNIERALCYGEPLGGHIVNGHVDTTGTISKVREVDHRDWEVTIQATPDFTLQLVKKGSVAIDGVSLTVVEVTESTFTVHVIPHTRKVTSLGEWTEGSHVNLEADVLAKYIKKLVTQGVEIPKLTWEVLHDLGRSPGV